MDDLRNEVLQNSELQAIVKECPVGNTTHYKFKDGLLYFKNRLRLAFDYTIKKVVLQEFHSFPIGGHAGVLKTFIKLSPKIF